MCQFPRENLIKIWYNSVQKECKQSLSLFYFSCCKRACPLHSVHWWVRRNWWDKNCPRSSAIFQNDPESVACWIGWVSTCFLSCGSFFEKDQFYTFERNFFVTHWALQFDFEWNTKITPKWCSQLYNYWVVLKTWYMYACKCMVCFNLIPDSNYTSFFIII